MTPSELKRHVESGEDSLFFSRKTMKFWGDTMRNYRVLPPEPVETHGGTVLAYCLVRKRPVNYGVNNAAFFDATTFRQVHATAE